MRALQVYMVDMIATEYEAKCSALNVVETQHHTLAVVAIHERVYPVLLKDLNSPDATASKPCYRIADSLERQAHNR